ncbi:hypothetical protein L915_05827 [Phytophthora nicotianae]|uniref:Uncharacterized protein n=1 Tax=Phytophthora nicotianae TaxID=4792 RepID=W2H760_PHYNI|nr:hypothetical protein L915_05827 [Phytophthora nicotianae]
MSGLDSAKDELSVENVVELLELHCLSHVEHMYSFEQHRMAFQIESNIQESTREEGEKIVKPKTNRKLQIQDTLAEVRKTSCPMLV